MSSVYFCGPFSGQVGNDVKAWHEEAKLFLREHDIETISPLRWKRISDATMPRWGKFQSTVDVVMGTSKAIAARDYFDIRRSDVILAYLQNTSEVSIGSVMEISYGFAHQKPIVAVIDHTHDHPFVHACVTHECTELGTALEVIRRMF